MAANTLLTSKAATMMNSEDGIAEAGESQLARVGLGGIDDAEPALGDRPVHGDGGPERGHRCQNDGAEVVVFLKSTVEAQICAAEPRNSAHGMM